MDRKRAILIDFYIRPTWNKPTKGCVWSVKSISPCLTSGMGGGNIIPTFVEIWRESLKERL